MAHLLGAEVAARLARLHTNNAVTIRTDVRFDGFVGDSKVEGVAFATGEILPADLPANLVVVRIGASPATDWLAGSGLPNRQQCRV